MTNESWTCMACGDTRPDERIDVHTRYRRLVTPRGYGPSPAGSVITLNVRYCNDRPACRAAVHVIGDVFAHTGQTIGRDDPRVKRARKRVGDPALPPRTKHRRRIAAGRLRFAHVRAAIRHPRWYFGTRRRRVRSFKGR